jgi:hypothetical protein
LLLEARNEAIAGYDIESWRCLARHSTEPRDNLNQRRF